MRVERIQKSFLFANSEFPNFGCFQLGGLMCGEITTVMCTWAKEMCFKSPENGEILDGPYWPWNHPPVYTCTHSSLSCTSPFPTHSCHFAQQVVGSPAARCARETRCFVCSKAAAHPQCIYEFSDVCWNEHHSIEHENFFYRCITNTVMTIELLVCPFLWEKFLPGNYR